MMIVIILYPKGKSIAYIISGVFLFFADTIRPKIGYLVTASIIIIMLIATYLLNKQIKKLYLAITLGIQGTTYIVNLLYEKFNGWSDFRAYHKERAAWIDYAHPSFDNNPDLYSSVGWSDKLYKLVNGWFFMDRRVNTESFKILNAAKDKNWSPNWSLLNTVLISGHLRMTFILVIVAILVLILFCIKKKKVNMAVITMMFVIEAFAVFAYFALNGRLPYRVAFAIIIIYAIPSVMLIYREIIKNIHLGNKEMAITCLIAVIVALYSCFGHYGLMRISYFSSTSESRKKCIEMKDEVEQYAIEHPNNIYIYDLSLALTGNPFKTYSNGKPYNLTFWGGSGMYSPLYYDQLRANGLDELYPKQFLDDNVFFMSRKYPNEDLLDYLRDEISDAVSAKMVYEGKGFIVYSITDVLPDPVSAKELGDNENSRKLGLALTKRIVTE